ncbi:hypothetical protein [Aequorivita capsosiphonis]|uniref:hypothetical protein n=1 Tax=Aequorivita capsosiphonis TaxID=487317 RepID=UPI000409479B|nr:hypothetical protein [Aequorivita capsosiphonis]
MKIAVIAHSLFPIKEPYASKLERDTHLLCKSLLKLGHRVGLYAHPASDQTLVVKPIPFQYDGNVGYDLGPEKTGGRDFTMWYPNLFSQVNANGYDIVHNQALQCEPTPLKKYLNSILLTTFHSLQNIQLNNLNIPASNKCYYTIILISSRNGNWWHHDHRIIATQAEGQIMAEEYLNLYKDLIEFRFKE